MGLAAFHLRPYRADTGRPLILGFRFAPPQAMCLRPYRADTGRPLILGFRFAPPQAMCLRPFGAERRSGTYTHTPLWGGSEILVDLE